MKTLKDIKCFDKKCCDCNCTKKEEMECNTKSNTTEDLQAVAKAWQDELDKSLKQKIKKIGEYYGEDCIKAITVNILKMIHREKKDWINNFFNLEKKEITIIDEMKINEVSLVTDKKGKPKLEIGAEILKSHKVKRGKK